MVAKCTTYSQVMHTMDIQPLPPGACSALARVLSTWAIGCAPAGKEASARRIVATRCLVSACRLLHDDRDFEGLQTHLGLRVVDCGA